MSAKAKPDAKAAATKSKAKAANPSGKAGKAEKPTGGKAAQAAKAGNADLPEMLREVIKALGVIAARVEAVRRTLWRMSEVRNYEREGAEPDAKSRKQEIIRLLGEIHYPLWEGLVKDIQSGRIDTAPEYAEFRALPDWAAFRASLGAVAAKPEAKAKAKGGKR